MRDVHGQRLGLRALAAAALLLCAPAFAHAVACTNAIMESFEHGSSNAGPCSGTATSTTVIDGLYSANVNSSLNMVCDGYNTSNIGQVLWVQFKMRVTSVAAGTPAVMSVYESDDTTLHYEVTRNADKICLKENAVTTCGATVLATATNYSVGVYYDGTAGQPLRLYLNGALEVDTTVGTTAGITLGRITFWDHTLTSSGVNRIDSIRACWNGEDERYETAGLDSWLIIARQGTAGTATYSNATHTCSSCTGTNCSGTCATSTYCCATSETPFATAKNVVVGTAGESSTLTCSFASASCTGAGSQVIDSTYSNAVCQTRAWGKRATGGGPTANCTGGCSGVHCLLQRVNSVDSCTSVSPTTSDTLLTGNRFVPGAISYLTSMEHGATKGTGTGQDFTIEDQWVECFGVKAAAQHAIIISNPLRGVFDRVFADATMRAPKGQGIQSREAWGQLAGGMRR